jgi:hypothetical protein
MGFVTGYEAVLLARLAVSDPPADRVKGPIVEELVREWELEQNASSATGKVPAHPWWPARRRPPLCGITTRRGRVVALAPPG